VLRVGGVLGEELVGACRNCVAVGLTRRGSPSQLALQDKSYKTTLHLVSSDPSRGAETVWLLILHGVLEVTVDLEDDTHSTPLHWRRPRAVPKLRGY
jgi:hypothetical protein